MQSSVCQIKITCPHCSAETWLVAEQTNPIILKCQGCTKILIIQDGGLYSVSEDFLRTKIMPKFRMSDCGKIVNYVPKEKPKPSQEQQLLHLKKILSENLDVSDFLNRI